MLDARASDVGAQVTSDDLVGGLNEYPVTRDLPGFSVADD